MAVPPADPRFTDVVLAGRAFRALDFDHEAVSARVREEMRAGIDVYWDRRWGLTRAFCRFVLERPELVRGRGVLAAGAGAGLEAVALGVLARHVVVNDLAPVSLELAAEQLRANGVEAFEIHHGPMEEVPLEGIDLVVACFVVYDEPTRDAVAALLERAAERRIPALLANEDIEGFFDEVLAEARRPVEVLARPGDGRIVRVG